MSLQPLQISNRWWTFAFGIHWSHAPLLTLSVQECPGSQQAEGWSGGSGMAPEQSYTTHCSRYLLLSPSPAITSPTTTNCPINCPITIPMSTLSLRFSLSFSLSSCILLSLFTYLSVWLVEMMRNMRRSGRSGTGRLGRGKSLPLCVIISISIRNSCLQHKEGSELIDYLSHEPSFG